MIEKDSTTSEQARRPFLPTVETWAFCEKLAEEKGLTPSKVLSMLTASGESIAKLNRIGVSVVAKHPDGEIPIDVFKDR